MASEAKAVRVQDTVAVDEDGVGVEVRRRLSQLREQLEQEADLAEGQVAGDVRLRGPYRESGWEAGWQTALGSVGSGGGNRASQATRAMAAPL